jgi:hypothetical protein
MQRKIVVVVGIYIVCLVLILVKHYVYANFIDGVSSESILNDALLVFFIGTGLAIVFWKRSEKRATSKPVTKKQQAKFDFYTVPIAMSVFALYLLLFVMRLIIFIDMYAEKPFLLMLEFPIIAIVAIFLFIPFIIRKIDFDDDDDHSNET